MFAQQEEVDVIYLYAVLCVFNIYYYYPTTKRRKNLSSINPNIIMSGVFNKTLPLKSSKGQIRIIRDGFVLQKNKDVIDEKTQEIVRYWSCVECKKCLMSQKLSYSSSALGDDGDEIRSGGTAEGA